jgi:GT2 family glycosyltransferase
MVNIGSANVKSNKGKLGSYFVILTCRNSQDTIKKALESHKMQTLQADYILVVDDGSSDNTASI